MVARIRNGKTVKGAINYNEKKVKEGKASLIHVSGYPKDPDALNFYEKLNRLQNLASLNTRAETNCLHVSLNFDPSEKLSEEKLQKIAEAYMERIGFGSQPYLVYEHKDAAHQHIHIVSINIQKDGKRISLHNLGRTKSESARKEIEVSFRLVKAGDKQQKELRPLRPINLEKLEYGKSETKRAISNIVTQVISQYKFSSIPEFNAVLQQFKVIADRGEEDSRMFKNKGLLYSMIDRKGTKIGVPIKASNIYERPTISNLEKLFETNTKLKSVAKEKVRAAISVVLKSTSDRESFTDRLKASKIDVVYRTNQQNFLYGITYVDHQTKAVFNGSELGKEFSAAALREKWADSLISGSGGRERHMQPDTSQPTKTADSKNENMLDALTAIETNNNYLPYQLKRKRKKGRRRI